MDTFKSFKSKLYAVNDKSFSDIALEVFRYQAINNPIYNSFIQHLSIKVAEIKTCETIPFLPISFLKTHLVQSGKWNSEAIFTSSGTSSHRLSQHAVKDFEFYQHHSKKCFEFFFGPLDHYHFLALLPSYLERQGSSLIAMMDYFIQQSQSPYSSYYLHQTDKLLKDLEMLRTNSRKVILWGVSFALLDLAEQHHIDLSHCIVFETGGMKGRRKEITRAELHSILHDRLNVQAIYSEYGMTELLSQAYTSGRYTFQCPPWMKIIGRELTDPLTKGLLDETAGINVIDLANFSTISFIETEDLGRVCQDGSFEILGRIDNSDVRGCNLMIE